MQTLRTMLLAGASAGTLFTASAQAQEIGDGPSAQEAEIVVTAQFVRQDPIDVPIALTVMTGDMLDNLGIEDFEELARFVPGFEFQNQSPNDPGFVIRGITSGGGEAFIEPRVSVFQDGVSISRSRGSNLELFDLERVEVVKGPQSTLYGRSALTGAVNLIQNKARLGELSGYVRAEYGNLDAMLGEAALNLPLGDSAALRVSGRLRRRDGIVENLSDGADFGSQRSVAARVALRIEPGERFTLDIIANYQHDNPTGTPFVALTKSQTDPASGAVLAPPSPFGGAWLASAPSLEGGRPLGFDRDVYGVTGLAEYRLGDSLTLNSVTAWRRFKALEILDADGISLPILSAAEDARGRQFSQDMRLRWDNGGPLSAFVGASYFHERGSQRTPTVFDERILLAQLAGALNGMIPGRPASDPAPLAVLQNTAFSARLLRGLAASQGISVSSGLANAIAANLKSAHQETATNNSRTRAWDVFADATFSPDPKLELTAGVRYSRENKRSGISAAVVNGRSILGGFIGALSQPAATRTALLNALAVPGAATIPPSAAYPVPLFGLAGQPTANNGDIVYAGIKDGGLSFRATARFAPDSDTSFYAGYARGRRPQVLSARTPAAPFGAARFEELLAEHVDSFEIGAKAALLDRRLTLDAALFHYRYSNFQTTEQSGVLFVTTNAGKARSTGVETQFRYAAGENFELFGNYAWNRSRFRSGARRGNHFRLAPDHSAALGAIVKVRTGPGTISFTPSLTWQSKTWFDSDNDRADLQQPPNALVADNVRDEFQKSFVLANARLGFAPASNRWRIEAFVENIFDRDYLRDAGNTGDALGLATGVRGNPRTWGVAVRIQFGG